MHHPDISKPEAIVLSITVPTLNRSALLETTLHYLLQQLEDAMVPIELIVSDNASDDNTSELFANNILYASKINYIRFSDRADIDTSFKRAISVSRGKYVLLFGDDDIPLPGFIKEITRTILEMPGMGLYYVNRIIGDMNLIKTDEIAHANSPFGHTKMEIGTFINTFTHWPGFVTCLIFSKSAWEKGASAVHGNFEGYNFLFNVYSGCREMEACYIASPLVLQRRGVQLWKKHWPSYWLISMPMLLAELDKEGVTSGSVAAWSSREVSDLRFAIDCFVAKAYDYSFSSDFWRKSRSYQASKRRKLISYIIQLLVPCALAKVLYSKTKKMT